MRSQTQLTPRPEPDGPKTQIADAAIQLLATGGLRCLTHRYVARTANVSLAATTYYYDSKDEILALASKRLLNAYTDAVRRAAGEIRQRQRHEPDFRTFVRRLLWSGAGRNRDETVAWCEVMFELARTPEGREIARAWYVTFEQVLGEVADAIGVPNPERSIQSAIHTTAGLMLMIVSLRLDPQRLSHALDGLTDPMASWAPAEASALQVAPAPLGAKAARTRETILQAAVDIIAAEGPAALSYRSLSERTGLTTSAPAYHFASIERIVSLALGRLLAASNQRLLGVFSDPPAGVEDVLRRMLSHLQVEAGARRREALGAFVAWAHASRDPLLRADAWRALGEQRRMWTDALAVSGFEVRPMEALLCQAMLAGRLVRLVAVGASPDEIQASEPGFRSELQAILAGRSYI